jgi:hypothetical protein
MVTSFHPTLESDCWVSTFSGEPQTIELEDIENTTISIATEAAIFVRILSHEATTASRLIASAGMPTTAWHFPLTWDDSAVIEETIRDEMPQDWIVEGKKIVGATLFLTGFSSMSTSRVGGSSVPGIQPGVVVGRLDDRAWLGTIKGGDNLERFLVDVNRGPNGPMLWDLELDLEERVDFELLSARRLKLGDVELPGTDAVSVTVALPTLGPALVRKVRLWDRSGYLLDGSDYFDLVERVNIGFTSGRNVELATGTDRTPGVEGRLMRIDEAEVQYEDLLAKGLAGRIIQNGANTTSLTSLLAAVRGELLIFDPYFGRDPNDWTAVSGVAADIRVLTGGKGTPPPANITMASSSVDVKIWNGTSSNPMFHDRAYLWDDGGLIVGTSPSGLGNRLSLIDPLTPHAVAALKALFEGWWRDPDFV